MTVMTSSPDYHITVGVPLLNSELSVRRTLDSVLAQTFTNYRVIISDNSSTDNTVQICNEFCEKDTRFELIRRDHTVSPVKNFSGILVLAQSSFFVFIAGDDYWDPQFLERTCKTLTSYPKASAATVKVRMIGAEGYNAISKGTATITGSNVSRLISYFNQQPSDNSRFYGLFRTNKLRKAFSSLEQSFHAFDWAIMAISLWHGEHIEVSDILLSRDYTDSGRYLSSVDQDNYQHFWLGIPLLPMSLHVLRNISFWAWPFVLASLVRLNRRKLAEFRKFRSSHLDSQLPLY